MRSQERLADYKSGKNGTANYNASELITLAPFPGKRNELFKMVQTMSAASCSMLKPERRRSQRPDQRGVASRFANWAQKKPRSGSRGPSQ